MKDVSLYKFIYKWHAILIKKILIEFSMEFDKLILKSIWNKKTQYWPRNSGKIRTSRSVSLLNCLSRVAGWSREQRGVVRPGTDVLTVGYCDCLLKVRWVARGTWQAPETNHSSIQRWWACWAFVLSLGLMQVLQRGSTLSDTRPIVTNVCGITRGMDKFYRTEKY